jgi:DNA (cytosine-5)-methyltransferase 1
MQMKKNIWDNSIPVEKSSYIVKDVQFLNYENFRAPNNGKYNMIDLFSGAGGFACGCSFAGFESILGIDHFEPAMMTWLKNHPDSIGCLGDIRAINPEKIKKMLEEKGIERIHLLTGGVPCQGFSLANRKHNDFDERNFLFLEYMKYVRVLKPDYIILENVSGMRSTAGGKFEEDIKQSMEELGYTTTVKLINAADYGVPQIRHRLVFVGVRRNSGLSDKYYFPEGDFVERNKQLNLFNSTKKPYRTVREAIFDLPALENNESKNKYKSEPLNEYQKIMRGFCVDYGIAKPAKLSNHVAPNHPADTVAKIASTKPGEPMYTKFKQRIRLALDKPSPTQLAGGIRPQFQFGHPTQPRGLSIRERARIQSFPDSYIFVGGIVQERVQTGNAVPPLMIYELVKPIANDLDKKYKKK